MNARRVTFGMIGLPNTPPKYRNKATVFEGLKFDSKREASRWRELQLLQRSGRIRNLQRQVKYRLEVNGVLICTYTADFEYEELGRGAWAKVTEDSKGYANDRWPMKKKLMRACHGIEVRET